MTEIPTITYWGLIALSGLSMVQAVLTLRALGKKEQNQAEHWATDNSASIPSPPGTAPPGFKWVLMREETMHMGDSMK